MTNIVLFSFMLFSRVFHPRRSTRSWAFRDGCPFLHHGEEEPNQIQRLQKEPRAVFRPNKVVCWNDAGLSSSAVWCQVVFSIPSLVHGWRSITGRQPLYLIASKSHRWLWQKSWAGFNFFRCCGLDHCSQNGRASFKQVFCQITWFGLNTA